MVKKPKDKPSKKPKVTNLAQARRKKVAKVVDEVQRPLIDISGVHATNVVNQNSVNDTIHEPTDDRTLCQELDQALYNWFNKRDTYSPPVTRFPTYRFKVHFVGARSKAQDQNRGLFLWLKSYCIDPDDRPVTKLPTNEDGTLLVSTGRAWRDHSHRGEPLSVYVPEWTQLRRRCTGRSTNSMVSRYINDLPKDRSTAFDNKPPNLFEIDTSSYEDYFGKTRRRRREHIRPKTPTELIIQAYSKGYTFAKAAENVYWKSCKKPFDYDSHWLMFSDHDSHWLVFSKHQANDNQQSNDGASKDKASLKDTDYASFFWHRYFPVSKERHENYARWVDIKGWHKRRQQAYKVEAEHHEYHKWLWTMDVHNPVIAYIPGRLFGTELGSRNYEAAIALEQAPFECSTRRRHVYKWAEYMDFWMAFMREELSLTALSKVGERLWPDLKGGETAYDSATVYSLPDLSASTIEGEYEVLDIESSPLPVSNINDYRHAMDDTLAEKLVTRIVQDKPLWSDQAHKEESTGAGVTPEMDHLSLKASVKNLSNGLQPEEGFDEEDVGQDNSGEEAALSNVISALDKLVAEGVMSDKEADMVLDRFKVNTKTA